MSAIAAAVRSGLRFLRSPKLALGLVLGIAAYSVVGTMFPQTSGDPTKAAAWQAAHPVATVLGRPLGMFSAFGSPAFLAAVTLLAVSTAVCAWARTRAAARASARQPVTPGLREALRCRPVVVAGPFSPDSRDAQLSGVDDAFSKSGFSTSVDGGIVSATRTLWGACASPVFHWALVLLFVFVAAGRLTRAEGRLPVPVGGSVIDATDSYVGPVYRGALYSGHSGLVLRARDLQMKTIVDGMDRGPSAVVGLYRATDERAGTHGAPIAQARVYPNSPLRYRSLLIHPGSWGYAPLFDVESSSGERVASAHAYIDQSAVASDTAGPGGLTLSGGQVDGWEVGVSIPIASRDAAGKPVLANAVRVTVTPPGKAASAPVILAQGGRTEVAPGVWLRFVDRGMFVGVNVADDWSVPWIYALLIGASIALAMAVFFPPRRVWLMAVEDGGRVMIHAITREQRGSPGFPDQVATIMSTALPDDVEVRVVCN